MDDNRLINEDLAPTTPEQRTWSMWHIAALWVGMSVCIPTYLLASNLIDQGFSLWVAVGCVALGNVVVLVPMVLNAHAGTKYGIPFPVLLRASFGVIGANIPAMMRALVACGWFGIQTWIGGKAIHILAIALAPDVSIPNVLPAFMGITSAELICFLAFWGVNVIIIARGIDSIKILETWAAPFLLLFGIALFVWAWVKVGSVGDMLELPGEPTKSGWSALGIGMTTGVAFWGTLALNIPDFARYARSQRDQVIGQTLGLPPTMTMFAFIGAAVTNASALIFGARISDPVVLVGKIGGPAMTILAMFCLAIATLSTNLAANVVGPANDFSNLSPARINFRRGAFIASGIAVIIMPWKLMSSAGAYLFTWLLGYGALLGAVGGIMIADYFVIRGCKLNMVDIYRRGGEYEYRGGFNLVAIIALIVGIAPNVPGFLGALGVFDPGYAFSKLYEWAWFVAFFGAGVTHVVGMKLLMPAPAAPERAPLDVSADEIPANA